MTVYLGDNGRVLISRSGVGQAYFLNLENSDINVSRRRFSIDAAGAQFITGDVIEIATELTLAQKEAGTPESIPLELVPGNVDDQGNIYDTYKGHVHVDELGGLRLYENLDDAIEGKYEKAVELGTFENVTEQLISLKTVPQSTSKCLAQIRSFQITTSRETIDTTCLSNRYRQQYEDGLIEGQGTLTCFWDFARSSCETEYSPASEHEFAEYLAQLCIRLVHGCDFHGYFYLHYAGDADKKSTWYECKHCLVTNVAVTVEPTEIVAAEIQFVTSGPILLRHGYPPSNLLIEDGSALLQESGDNLLLNNSNE